MPLILLNIHIYLIDFYDPWDFLCIWLCHLWIKTISLLPLHMFLIYFSVFTLAKTSSKSLKSSESRHLFLFLIKDQVGCGFLKMFFIRLIKFPLSCWKFYSGMNVEFFQIPFSESMAVIMVFFLSSIFLIYRNILIDFLKC